MPISGYRETMRAVAIVLWLLVTLMAAAARAEGSGAEPAARILVLLDDAPREGLTDALRIHAPKGTRVVVGPRPRAPTAAGRIREAHEALSRREGAVLSMWLEEDRLDGEAREVIVYLVGRRRDTALVEVVRVRAGASEELDRAIAIKAREVLDAWTSDRGLPALLAQPAEAPARPTGPDASAPVALAIALELSAYGATAAATAGPQLGAQIALGPALEGEGWLAEVVGTARIPMPLSRASGAGSVEVHEIAFGGAARALWAGLRAPVALGGFAHCGARVLSGHGTTPLGATGIADRIVPFLAAGPEVRLTLALWLRVRVAVGAEIALSRQRFAVNGEPVLDLGPARGLAEVGLLATAF
jgi:hypothetical protein